MIKMQNSTVGTHQIHFFCNTQEFLKLTQMSKNTGFTKTKILRNLINNAETPLIAQADIRECYTQFHKIGVNINQIAARYNSSGFLDLKGLTPQLEELGEVTANLFDLITTAKLSGEETENWKEEIGNILDKSKDPSDFLSKFWQNAHRFCK